MAYSARTKLGAPRSLPSRYAGTQHTRVRALMHTGKAHAITISIVHGVRRKATGTRTLWPLAQCATATSTTSATPHGQAHYECQHHECHSHEPQCTTTGTGTTPRYVTVHSRTSTSVRAHKSSRVFTRFPPLCLTAYEGRPRREGAWHILLGPSSELCAASHLGTLAHSTLVPQPRVP